MKRESKRAHLIGSDGFFLLPHPPPPTYGVGMRVVLQQDMNKWTTLALVGVLMICLATIPSSQASSLGGHGSRGGVSDTTADGLSTLEFEALLQDYLDQMRDMKELIQRYLASVPYSLSKRAQFLRLGRK
ncbi:hypothetical protein EGR_06178 [Echinococcus granulosus]|uniref:Uncharacterized protein n=2 Tax=Echinococcus granulosus TaxID=6210 RepID=W6UZC0_ECHGR|nr:hypothetical protein EGR_06178 [Echinococcus granulosus]EUB58959.1 hypothetical protein EGR_06178 [Echinococcus granulosus]